MRCGKIPATFLGIAGLILVCVRLVEPGWGNPPAALGGLLILLSFPTALLFGITGIIKGRPRKPAIIAITITGGLVLLYVSMVGYTLICR